MSCSCQRQMDAFEQCARRHPRDIEVQHYGPSHRDCTCRTGSSAPAPTDDGYMLLQVVCRSLQAAVAWCVVSDLCPDEAASVEDCAGGRRKSGAPPSVPRHCSAAAERLDECLERRAAEVAAAEEQAADSS